jgi:hypothetical protein
MQYLHINRNTSAFKDTVIIALTGEINASVTVGTYDTLRLNWQHSTGSAIVSRTYQDLSK